MCVAFSPDGSRILTGSTDNTVKLRKSWNYLKQTIETYSLKSMIKECVVCAFTLYRYSRPNPKGYKGFFES